MQFTCGHCGSAIVVMVDLASSKNITIKCPDCGWSSYLPASAGQPISRGADAIST